MSLNDFAAAQPRAYNCRLCKMHTNNPTLYAEVVEGRERTPPHPYPTISAYLKQQGHPVTPNMVRDHFLNNHKERFR